MVKQEPFHIEQFMNDLENDIEYNLGETCCYSMSIKDVIKLLPESEREAAETDLHNKVFDKRLVYGWITGSDQLKSAIAKIYNDDHKGEPVTNDNIVVTNGAIGANFLTCYSMIDPGDKVIAVEPSYQQLTSVPNMFSQGNLIKYDLHIENGYKPDLEYLASLVKQHKPKAFVINNPNNPTGYMWDNSVLTQIIDICREYGVYILCDEVYRPLYHSSDNPPTSIVNLGYDKAISTGSMSKAFSLAGLRLGWIVSHDKDLIEDISNKRDYNTIAISSVDDIFSTFALNHYQQILKRNYELCRNNLVLLEKFVGESNGLISWIKPTAGTTAFIKFNIADFCTYDFSIKLAKKYRLLLVPGECFNRPGYARVGYGNSLNDLVRGLSVLKQALQDSGYWKSL